MDHITVDGLPLEWYYRI